MSNKDRNAERRRVARAERRRVKQKERKAERRASPNRNLDKSIEDELLNFGLSDKVLERIPQEAKEQAVARCFRLMERAETATTMPPGYSVTGSERTWTVVPPPDITPLVKMFKHPARDLAIAFAWELADGLVDVEGAAVIAHDIMREFLDTEKPEGVDPYVVIALGGIPIAAELLTGYHLVAEMITHDPQLRAEYLGAPPKDRSK